MKVKILVTFLALLILTGSAAVVLPTTANSTGPEAISVFGVGRVDGRDTLVHIVAVVPPGRTANDVASAVLAEHGARPLRPADYSLLGGKWPQFSDGTQNPSVEQNYNPANEPSASAGTALASSRQTWNGVSGSSFRFSSGADTNRCPSLVRECAGPQTYDGENDVGWVALSGCCTLGVTWIGSSGGDIVETDMALNSKFTWDFDCSGSGAPYSAEAVFLHENGHVAGLGHSSNTSAVMYSTYQVARCTLHPDDIDGLLALYGPDSGDGGDGGGGGGGGACPPAKQEKGKC